MASPKAAPLSLLADTEEEQTAVEQYKKTQKELRDALESRKNQLFDPVLLAIAQGFLAPTKAGGFGESLSNVAALVGPAQERQQKREMEMAQIRAELAAQELGQMQATRGEREFRRLIGQARGEPAPGAAAPSGAAPAAPAAAAPAGAEAPRVPAAQEVPSVTPSAAQPSAPSAAPSTAAPSGFSILNPMDIVALGRRPGQGDNAKALMDAIKLERDRFILDQQTGRVWDKSQGAFVRNVRVPFEKQEKYRIGDSTYTMTPSQHDAYLEAREQGRGGAWLQNFLRPDVPGAAAGMSEEAREARAAGLRESAVKGAAAETERTQSAISAGSVSDRLASYTALETIAGRKDAGEIFGIVNRPDVGSAIVNLVQESLRAGPSVTISAPALESAMRNVGLSQDQINRYQFALGIMANIQLQQAKLAQGQGSVSNFERELFAQAAISPRDNPETIVRKVQMLRARAELDRELARELRRSKMSLDEFKDERADQYNRLVNNYEQRVGQIAASFGVKTTTPGIAPTRDSSEASRVLRNKLGLP